MSVAVSLLALLLLAGCGRPAADFNRDLPYGLIALGSEEYDFGERRQNETLSHTFSLLNNTVSAVKITKITTTCQCTTAGDGRSDSTLVAPGDTFSLPVEFTTSVAQETAAARIDVRYENAEDVVPEFQAELSLTVRADVLPDYRVTPTSLDVGTIDGLTTQTITRTIRFEPVAVADVTVTAVTTSRDYVDAELVRDEDGPGANVEVTLDLSGFSQNRQLNGLVVLETTSERAPNAVVNVRGRWQARVEARPDAIVISSAERGPLEREILFSSTRPSCIVKAGSSTPALKAEWSGGVLAMEHLVRLTVPACEEAALDAELEVEFELPDVNKAERRVRHSVTVPIYRFQPKENDHDQAE